MTTPPPCPRKFAYWECPLENQSKEHLTSAERTPESLAQFLTALRAYADNEYCLGIGMAHREDKCLGWEHKVKTGKFGKAEKDAHTKMYMHLGAHYGIHEAIKRALERVAPTEHATNGPESLSEAGAASTEALQARIAEMEEDAARYRWLRDVGDATWRPFALREGYSATKADAAIDAARAALKEQKP